MIEPLFIISLARSDDEMESDTEDTECVTPSEKKMPTNFIPWYRAAKSIYNSGPEGEGQDMWKALKTYQQGRKEHEKEMSTPWQRRDSGISRPSAEVPIVSERRVRSIVDTNKPLPPVPRMSPAPKTRWKKMHPIRSGQSPKKPRMENDAARIWWKPQSAQAQPSLKSKISYPGPLMTSNTGENANVPAEYGGIGGPSSAVYLHVTRTGTPLAQPQNTSAPIEKEAKNPSPSNLVPVASRLKTKMDAKGKGKAPLQDDNPSTHWRNVVLGSAFEAGKLFKQNAMGKLDGVYAGRRRKSSDVSFVCRGVPDEWLDRDQVSNDRVLDQIAGAHDKNPMPGPWFAADRDTEFYQAYFEVLDDY